MPDYAWRNNNACVATYKVLEQDAFLDQFEDSDISFDDAPDVKLGDLRYFPKTTQNPNILEGISLEMARYFIKYAKKIYTISKQNIDDESADIIREIASVFRDPDKTIRNLAEVVDRRILFPDENGGGA